MAKETVTFTLPMPDHTDSYGKSSLKAKFDEAVRRELAPKYGVVGDLTVTRVTEFPATCENEDKFEVDCEILEPVGVL